MRRYWEAAANIDRDDQGLRPVARDPFLQQIVEDEICRLLPEGETLLDVGCGDGHSSLRFARLARSLVGVDFIERFVERAREKSKSEQVGNSTFVQGSALDLSSVRARFGLFGAAISIRCLINLTDKDAQLRALREIAACVRPGGLYLTSEGWAEGLEGLNALRRKAGLAKIEAAPYNLMISRRTFEEALSSDFTIEAYVNLGHYLVMSRVVQPLVEHPAPPHHGHEINKLAALSSEPWCRSTIFRECDYAGIYVLRRRG